jgi:hypothetical protein
VVVDCSHYCKGVLAKCLCEMAVPVRMPGLVWLDMWLIGILAQLLCVMVADGLLWLCHSPKKFFPPVHVLPMLECYRPDGTWVCLTVRSIHECYQMCHTVVGIGPQSITGREEYILSRLTVCWCFCICCSCHCCQTGCHAGNTLQRGVRS